MNLGALAVAGESDILFRALAHPGLRNRIGTQVAKSPDHGLQSVPDVRDPRARRLGKVIKSSLQVLLRCPAWFFAHPLHCLIRAQGAGMPRGEFGQLSHAGLLAVGSSVDALRGSLVSARRAKMGTSPCQYGYPLPLTMAVVGRKVTRGRVTPDFCTQASKHVGYYCCAHSQGHPLRPADWMMPRRVALNPHN